MCERSWSSTCILSNVHMMIHEGFFQRDSDCNHSNFPFPRSHLLLLLFFPLKNFARSRAGCCALYIPEWPLS